MKYILILLCLCSVSCNQTKLAAEWADTFLAWEVNDTFDLTSPQKKQVRVQIDESLKVVKKEMFPEYSSMLEQAKVELSQASTQPAAESTVTKISAQMESLIKATLKKVKPQVLAASEQITLENWDEFKDDFEDRNEEIQEEANNKSGKKFKSRVEEWVGSLSKDQTKAIEDFRQANAFPNSERLKNRIDTMAKFEQKAEITKTSFNNEKFKATISEIIDDYEGFQSEDYRKSVKAYRGKLNQFLAQFYLSLDQKQKDKLFANIQQRASDLREISQEN